MSGVSRADRAARRVSQWVSLYTRGLPLAVAGERRAELESDLYEHAAQGIRNRVDDRVVAREIESRALRGIVADLLWRDSRMREFRAGRLAAMTVRELRSTKRLSWLLYFIGIAVSVVGLAASVRATTNVSIYGDASMGVPIFLTAVLAVVSLGLILRSASRVAGVILLAVSCALLNWYMLAASANLSARGVAHIVRALAFIPPPLMVFIFLVPALLVAAALVLILRKLHRIEQHPSQ